MHDGTCQFLSLYTPDASNNGLLESIRDDVDRQLALRAAPPPVTAQP